jgi:hypothetical protein
VLRMRSNSRTRSRPKAMARALAMTIITARCWLCSLGWRSAFRWLTASG